MLILIEWHKNISVQAMACIVKHEDPQINSVRVVHPEGPHLEGRRPETSRASGERADALVVLVSGLSESTSRWTMYEGCYE